MDGRDDKDFRIDKWMHGWYVRRNATSGEKTKDTLGDAESEETKKPTEYILISNS